MFQFFMNPWLLISLPASAVVAGFITLWLAATTNNSLVVDDYYKEGKAINLQLARDRVASQMGLSGTRRRAPDGSPLLELAATLPLATSGLVLGTGLFLLIQPFAPPMALALPVTILVNVALSLPYLYRILLPETRALQADYGRLADSLALTGWSRLRWLVLPRLARPLGFGAGIAAALSMGDLGVIALCAG